MKIRKNVIRTAVGVALASAAITTSTSALACNDDSYIGMVCLTAANYCPRGTLEANGALLSIGQYTTLYSLLSNTYGGDGRATFGLPDLRGRAAIGYGNGIGLTPVAWGGMQGVERVQISVSNLPAHNHTATFAPSSSVAAAVKASTLPGTKAQVAAGDFIASNKALGGDPKFIPAADAGTTVALGGVSGGEGTVTVDNTGGGQPIYNLPPRLGMKYCIVNEGIYPPRT